MIENTKACFFSGHRTIPSEHIEKLKVLLNKEIGFYISLGINTFITGGAIGFDTLAAYAVLEYKKINPEIKLYIYVPFKDQCKRWSAFNQRMWYDICSKADDVVILNEIYTSSCMKERNYKMVDDAQYGLIYHNGSMRSGTAQTRRYAVKKGRIFNNLYTMLDNKI